MRNHLPTRLLMFLGAMYVALTLAAAAANAAAPTPVRTVPLSTVATGKGGTFDAAPRPFRWSLTANPGVVDGTPRADQVLIQGTRSARCQSIHVNYAAGGQAQSAALILRRAGQADKVLQTQSDHPAKLDAALKPGQAWQLAASTPSISIAVYANGSVECRGAKGLR